MSKRIMLLLGSGIAVPSGQPKMTEMTAEMLDIKKGTSDYVEEIGTPLATSIPEIKKVLSVLKTNADLYFKRHLDRDAHYEDLYYLANQLRQERVRSYFNPAIDDFCKRMDAELKTKNSKKYTDIYTDVCEFINCLVWHLLATDNYPRNMYIISSICRDDTFTQVDIATLNLDLLIEKQLKNSDIKDYEDGFYKHLDYHFWDMNRFIESSSRIKLYKLHGSVNYFYGQSGDNSKSREVYKYTDWANLKNEFKDNHNNAEIVILNGTGNKLIAYGMGFFNQIMCCFEKQLYTHDTLVVSGYGFGDFAINQRILTWLLHSKSNKLFVFHDYEYEKLKIEGYFNDRFNEKVGEGKIVVVKQFLGNTDYDDFAKILNNKETRYGKSQDDLINQYLRFVDPNT